MIDKRRIEIPIYPYILFVLSLVAIFASGLLYLNYPSETQIIKGTLIASAILMLLSFITRPAIIKEVFTSKKAILWLNDIVLVFTIIGIGVLLSYIGFRRNFRYDFTKDKLFSISDQTIKTLRTLDKTIKVTAFYPKGTGEEEMIKNLLNEYQRQSDKFSFSIVDPRTDPITTKAMEIKTNGTLVVQCGTNRKDIFPDKIFERTDPRIDPTAKPKFRGEQVVTSAMISVLTGHKEKIQFVIGHEEASLRGYKGKGIAGVHELLTKENYNVVELNLMGEDIATDSSIVAIISPLKDYSDAEIEKLHTYVKDKNGRLLITLDPMNETPKLVDFITHEFGVMANNDIIVDPRGLQQGYWTVSPSYENHKIVAPLQERNLLCLMFHCRSLTLEDREDYEGKVFLKSIAKAWAKRNIDPKVKLQINYESDKDAMGPLNMAIALQNSKNASGSRIIIFGDSEFATNDYITVGGNKDLFVNSVNWLAGQEKLISIRPKIVDMPRIIMDENAKNRIFTFCVVVSPLLIILLGAFVFYTRRRV